MRLFNFVLPALLSVGAAIPTFPVKTSSPPTNGIAAAEDGTVYFVDSYHRTVWRIGPNGRVSPFVTGKNGKSLQIDDAGNIYGTHDEGRGLISVWRADPAGNVIEIARADMRDHGNAFVLDGGRELIGWTGSGKRTGVRIWRARDRERELLAGGEWGLHDGAGGEARFFPIGGIARGDDGELYVTSGATIRKVAPNGEVSTIACGDRLLKARTTILSWLIGDMQAHLTGIAVDDDGTIYVANAARDAVVRVGTDGRTTEVVTSEGGWKPTGVAASNGTLYVLEYGSGVRVRKVSSDGGTSIVAVVRADRAVASHPAHIRGLLSLPS